jgi:hypothetical protein
VLPFFQIGTGISISILITLPLHHQLIHRQLPNTQLFDPSCSHLRDRCSLPSAEA